MVAASLVVEEGLRCKRTGAPRRIKFAIFISGAPPLKMEGKNRITAQLSDEVDGAVIDIPTFHIFGCDDAFLSSAVALYNVCDQKTALMYDHGLGHIVPRDNENVGLLGNLLADVIPRIERENRYLTMAAVRRATRSLSAACVLLPPHHMVRTGSVSGIEMMGGRDDRGENAASAMHTTLREMDFTTGQCLFFLPSLVLVGLFSGFCMFECSDANEACVVIAMLRPVFS